MSYPSQPLPIFPKGNLKLEAEAFFQQLTPSVIENLEQFIAQNFKYPKGGGWDLDSLWQDIILQNDLEENKESWKWLPYEIAISQNLVFSPSEAQRIIEEELLWRYRPKVECEEDKELFKRLGRLFYVMEAVRLNIMGDQISPTTLPSQVVW